MPQRVTHVPSHLPLREGRDQYLERNGFSMAEYSSPVFAFDLFGRTLRLPNPPARQSVVALHDLHHVLTGYGTDLAGESEIGAWELRAGCNTRFLWMINLTAVMGGLFVAPLRTLRAFRAAKGQRTLYVDGRDVEAVLKIPIAELRRQLGIPAGGHTAAP
ncbi:hypothetical protein [Nannocystis punicea]|uniref:Ubiquinone biosynthesis protein COQ4 n=1 Tax=Nannocystis punicea TaxID=2995304 RepID=A0ABY7H551_9BACT|nr:hypothetical protein [Nannocystis poenicansa]WAS94394.1 hypothetical protein O0S08_50385 [Nannocystis poenicansa]